jgi:hypothetical protein
LHLKNNLPHSASFSPLDIPASTFIGRHHQPAP